MPVAGAGPWGSAAESARVWPGRGPAEAWRVRGAAGGGARDPPRSSSGDKGEGSPRARGARESALRIARPRASVPRCGRLPPPGFSAPAVSGGGRAQRRGGGISKRAVLRPRGGGDGDGGARRRPESELASERGGSTGAMAPAQRPLLPLLLLLLPLRARNEDPARANADRYAVYWNRSNPRFQVGTVGDGGGYTVEVSINDYLDIYCPHYGAPLPPAEHMERYILYMVNGEGHASCDHRQRGFKRWECNRPAAPGGPLKFSEKFQLFTPFSLGFEFRPGHEYYYISATPPNLVDRPCLRLKVYVRPANETLYEAEPIFTSNSSCSGLGGCHLFLSTVPVLWTLLGS